MPQSLGNVPAVASSKPPVSGRAPRRLLVVLGAALVVGLVAAWAVSAIRSRPRVVEVEVAAPGAAEPSAKDKEIALNEIPVTGQSNQVTGDKMATCVAGYLPKGAFAKPPDVSWMCNERDPREGGMKLRAAVVQGAPAGAPTEAMKLFSRLGWYELAAFAVIRAGCCEDAEAITLPDPSPNCKRMDEPLRELGQAVVAGQNHEAALKGFNEAIHCELNAGRAALYRRAGRPQGGEDSAFQELVKVIQAP
jgi:serine/threonine-protein kinase